MIHFYTCLRYAGWSKHNAAHATLDIWLYRWRQTFKRWLIWP